MWFYHMKRKQIYLKHWAVLEKHSVKISGNNDLSWKGLDMWYWPAASAVPLGTTSAHVASTCRQSQGLHSWFNCYWLSGLTTSLAVYLHVSRGNKGRTHESGFLCSAWWGPRMGWRHERSCTCSKDAASAPDSFGSLYSFTQQILLKHLQSSKLSIKWWAEQTQSLSSQLESSRNIFWSPDCKLWEKNKILLLWWPKEQSQSLLWCMNLNNKFRHLKHQSRNIVTEDI